MSDICLIRKLRAEECEALHGLIVEQGMFHGMATAVTVSAEELRRDFEDNAFDCLVAEGQNTAEDNGKLIGCALYFMNYQGFVGKTAFMDQLFVKEKYTGQGVGTALWTAFSKDVLQRGALRVSLYVIDWNSRAKTFYKNKDAKDYSDVYEYKVYDFNHKDLGKHIEMSFERKRGCS